MKISSWIVCLAMTGFTASGYADIVSHFDTEGEGWISDSAYSWESAGGNSGGYIRFDNNISKVGSVFAPDKFLGDWSALEIESIQWDIKVIDRGNVIPGVDPYNVRIEGGGGSAIWTGGVPSSVGNWVTLTASLEASEWNVSGNWEAILADITQVEIDMSFYNNGTPKEITGLDNVILTQAEVVVEPVDVPETNTNLLLLLGLLGLMWKRKNAEA